MKLKKMLCCLLAVVMVISVAVNVVACEKTGETVTVSWYDGRQELKTETVAKGSKAQEWQPSKNGYDFFGWYEDAAFGNPFDFDKELQEDTDIYARWRSSNPTEDNRMWYVIGSVPGENWDFLTEKNDEGVWVKSSRGQEASNQKYFFTNEGNNVFSVTLTLRPNCKFQFVTNLVDKTTWEGDEGKGRMGLGNIKGFEYASGVNPEADGGLDGYHDIEDKMYGEVKDDKGNVVFNGGQGYDVATYCWNIYPAVGSDGVYKFTFKSYPGEEAINVVEWELLEKLDPLESFFDMYLTGSYHNNPDDVNPSTNTGPADVWDDDPEADWCVHLSKVEGSTLHRGYLTVTPDMYPTWSKSENPSGQSAIAFKVKNNINGKDYGCGGKSGTPGTANCWTTAGTWCITFDEETEIVTWELCEYYVVGTFKVSATNYDNIVTSEKITPKMSTKDNGTTYEAEVNVPDVSSAEGYQWLAEKNNDEGKHAVFAIKVAHGCSLGIREVYGTSPSAGDAYLYFYETGTYRVVFNASDNTVTATKTSEEYHELVTVKVYYFEVIDGMQTKINEEDVLQNDTITWRPTGRLGYKFDGWYYDMSCTNRFQGAVSENTALYCRFVEGYELDERDYYIVGSGLAGGTLGTYNSFVKTYPEMRLVRQDTPDSDGLTLYTIELTMYTGDTFKVVHDLSWTSGTHFGYTQLHDAEDRFMGSGVGNIILKTGQQGKYLIRFHSNPYDYNQSYIDYEFLEPIEAKNPYKMYLIGNFEGTGWNEYNQNQNFGLPMTLGEDGVTWSVTAHFCGGDYFKVWNSLSRTFFPDGTDDDIYIGVTKVKDEKDTYMGPDGTKYYSGDIMPGTGWYTITWSQDNPEVVVTLLSGKPEDEANKQVMYLIGNFEANGHDDKWATNKTDKMLAMTRDECGYTWSVTEHFIKGDQFKIYRYFFGTDGRWIPDGYNGSEWNIAENGTYKITWNHFTGVVTITNVDDATSA